MNFGDFATAKPSSYSLELNNSVSHKAYPRNQPLLRIETTFDRDYWRTVLRSSYYDTYEDEELVRVPTIPFPVKFAIKRYFQVWGKLTDDLFERAFVFMSEERKKLSSIKNKIYGDGLIDQANKLVDDKLKGEYPLIKKIFAKEAFRLLKLGLVRKNQQGEWTPVDIAKIYPEIPLLSSEAVAIIRNRAKQLAKKQ